VCHEETLGFIQRGIREHVC